MEWTKLAQGVEAFRAHVESGLAGASVAKRRGLVELLIDRVIVTGEEVEIRNVIPPSPGSYRVRFCHLRLNYYEPICDGEVCYLTRAAVSPNLKKGGLAALESANRQLTSARYTGYETTIRNVHCSAAPA